MLIVSQIIQFLSNVEVADQGQWFWRLGPDSKSREYQANLLHLGPFLERSGEEEGQQRSSLPDRVVPFMPFKNLPNARITPEA
jgi:hypothetical protein